MYSGIRAGLRGDVVDSQLQTRLRLGSVGRFEIAANCSLCSLATGGRQSPYNAFMNKNEPARPTPFERFEVATKRIFQVPKREVEKAELRKKEREGPEADPSK